MEPQLWTSASPPSCLLLLPEPRPKSRAGCDLWPHKRPPQGQSQPLFTSLNFIYRANEGSPTPETGQGFLSRQAVDPLPCQPWSNPKASMGRLQPATGAGTLPTPRGVVVVPWTAPSPPRGAEEDKRSQGRLFPWCNRKCTPAFTHPTWYLLPTSIL